MEDFKNLKVWAKAHELTLAIYKATQSFPREEIYELTSHMRRSSASIGANIAEGCGRRSDGEFKRFLQIAGWSAKELEYQQRLTKDLSFIPGGNYKDLEGKISKIQRMLAALGKV